jgi:hypothetical protein
MADIFHCYKLKEMGKEEDINVLKEEKARD